MELKENKDGKHGTQTYCQFTRNAFGLNPQVCNHYHGEFDTLRSNISVALYDVRAHIGGTIRRMYVCNKCANSPSQKKFYSFHRLGVNERGRTVNDRPVNNTFFLKQENGEKIAILNSREAILNDKKELVEVDDLTLLLKKHIFVIYPDGSTDTGVVSH